MFLVGAVALGSAACNSNSPENQVDQPENQIEDQVDAKEEEFSENTP